MIAKCALENANFTRVESTQRSKNKQGKKKKKKQPYENTELFNHKMQLF